MALVFNKATNLTTTMIKKTAIIAGAATCAILVSFGASGRLENISRPLRPAEKTGTVAKVFRDAISAAPPGAPPITEVTYRPIPVATARELNAAIPLASVGPPAPPFTLANGTPTWDRALHCLAQAVFYEAAGESDAGQRAVAHVVLNRVRSPAFPNSVCGVVFQGAERSTGCQFTFACDGSLGREASGSAWRRAVAVATSALKGSVFAPVGNATHYHANYVVPYWASSMAKVRELGAHDFYRWPGLWRASTYFSQRYANSEPDQFVLAPSPAVSSAQTISQSPIVEDITPGVATSTKTDSSRLAIDHQPHTLILSEHASALDPKLDQVAVLNADRTKEQRGIPPAGR